MRAAAWVAGSTVYNGGGREGEKLINTFTGDLQARQIKSSSFVEARRSRPAQSAIAAEFAMLNTLVEPGSGHAVITETGATLQGGQAPLLGMQEPGDLPSRSAGSRRMNTGHGPGPGKDPVTNLH